MQDLAQAVFHAGIVAEGDKIGRPRLPPMSRTSKKLVAALVGAALALAGSGHGWAAERGTAAQAGAAAPAKPSPVALEGVDVRPPRPGPDTLCQLRVRVKNGGSRKLSALGFEVKLNGQALPVYKSQLYLQTIAPGETAEVRLFNFWTTETGRSAPADGKLKVEVALKEAQWVEVKTEGGAEVWKPVGPVEGLPVAAAVILEMGNRTGEARPTGRP
jgi:hypothetical protein